MIKFFYITEIKNLDKQIQNLNNKGFEMFGPIYANSNTIFVNFKTKTFVVMSLFALTDEYKHLSEKEFEEYLEKHKGEIAMSKLNLI